MCDNTYNYGILSLKSDKNIQPNNINIIDGVINIKHLLLAQKHLVFFLLNHLNIKEKSKCNEN
jgi:hypothetical protein